VRYIAAAVLFASGLVALSVPHQARAQESCLSCHGQKGMTPYIDESLLRQSVHGAIKCTQCHTSVKGYPHGTVYRVDCASCHLTGGLGASQKAARAYSQSPHAEAVRKGSGPACKTCHGTHQILPSDNPDSRTYRRNVPKLCSGCHYFEYKIYSRSIHGTEVLDKGDLKAAICYDCHMEHAAPRVTEARWKLWLIEECGGCHKHRLETYRKTIHGEVTHLGYTTVAKCSDCHGFHDILPKSAAASTISSGKLLDTCRTCHLFAGRGITEYHPHPDEHNRAKYPILFYTHWFMKILLIGVFAFFLLHTFLWILRTLLERKRGEGNG
jgi:nitrate/TMAO reductase-like tetraheme cytochrome c subunit